MADTVLSLWLLLVKLGWREIFLIADPQHGIVCLSAFLSVCLLVVVVVVAFFCFFVFWGVFCSFFGGGGRGYRFVVVAFFVCVFCFCF